MNVGFYLISSGINQSIHKELLFIRNTTDYRYDMTAKEYVVSSGTETVLPLLC